MASRSAKSNAALPLPLPAVWRALHGRGRAVQVVRGESSSRDTEGQREGAQAAPAAHGPPPLAAAVDETMASAGGIIGLDKSYYMPIIGSGG